MNLIDMMHKDPEFVTGSCFEVLQGKVESPELISSLVALFRGDILSSRPVADKLGIQYKRFLNIMALTEANPGLMDEACRDVANQLNMKDSKSIEIIIKLANGDTKIMYDIAGKSNNEFSINNSGVLESLMYLSSMGSKILNMEGFNLQDRNIIHLLNDRVAELFKVLKRSLAIEGSEDDTLGGVSKTLGKSIKEEAEESED